MIAARKAGEKAMNSEHTNQDVRFIIDERTAIQYNYSFNLLVFLL